jgi:hypothetical protein
MSARKNGKIDVLNLKALIMHITPLIAISKKSRFPRLSTLYYRNSRNFKTEHWRRRSKQIGLSRSFVMRSNASKTSASVRN